jgi:hypothetical protein
MLSAGERQTPTGPAPLAKPPHQLAGATWLLASGDGGAPARTGPDGTVPSPGRAWRPAFCPSPAERCAGHDGYVRP